MRTFAIALLTISLALDGAGATIRSVGPMIVARQDHTATLLADGTVLIAAGVDDMGPSGVYKEEVYDPATHAFHAVQRMIVPRVGAAAVRLNDGRVLIVGGPRTAAANSEIYNPGSSSFSGLATISSERYHPGALLLADGRVLTVGGSRGGSPIATTEIFNPGSGGWVAGPAMNQPRDSMAIVRMNDGRVLVGGGRNSISLEIFDPGTGTFTVVPNASASATRGVLLPSGKVLLVGLGILQIFNPATQTVAISSRRLQTYRGEALVVLPNGSVLIAGGNIDGTVLSDDVYVWAPDSNSLTAIGKLTAARDSPTGTLLPDGTVLITGGYTNPGGRSSAAAEIIEFGPQRSRAAHH